MEQLHDATLKHQTSSYKLIVLALHSLFYFIIKFIQSCGGVVYNKKYINSLRNYRCFSVELNSSSSYTFNSKKEHENGIVLKLFSNTFEQNKIGSFEFG